MATAANVGNAKLQFEREATWGTYPTITKVMPCTVLTFESERGVIKPALMGQGRFRSTLIKGGEIARATIEFPIQYPNAADENGFLMFYDACFGTATYGARGFTTAVDTPAPPYLTHTYLTRNVFNSLSLDFVDGWPGGSSTCIRMVGCKIQEVEFRCVAGLDNDDAVLMCRATLVGKASTTGSAVTAAGNSQTFDPVLFSHIAALDDGISGSTTVWESFSIKLSNNLSELHSLEGAGGLAEPVVNGFATCEIKLSGYFDSYSHLNLYLNSTVTTDALDFPFTKPSASDNIWFKQLSGFAKVVAHEHDVSGDNFIRQTVTFNTIPDTNNSNTGLIMTIVTEAPASVG